MPVLKLGKKTFSADAVAGFTFAPPSVSAVLTFGSTLVIPLQYAVFVGIAVATLLHVFKSSNKVPVVEFELVEHGFPVDRKTLALNTKIRNLGLALLIAGNEFAGQHVEREIIVYSLIMYGVVILVAVYWRGNVKLTAEA